MIRIAGRYDLIIIGGGAAAFAAANTANRIGRRTLVINDRQTLPVGGTCVNVGCIPSKIMLHQGRLFYDSVRRRFRALSISGEADLMEALAETRGMVETFRKRNYESVIEKQEYVDFVAGRARLVSPDTVEVAGRMFRAARVLVATGAYTFVPHVQGIDRVPFLTNRTVFELREKPRSMVIWGGGPEAVEFAQIFNRFGVNVTILQRSDRILTKFDPMMAGVLQDALIEEGIKIYTGVSVRMVERTGGGIRMSVHRASGEGIELDAAVLLVATGLRADTDGLGCGMAGVERDERGFIRVDDFLCTSGENVYAAGDVTGLLPLETVAARQGHMAVMNMFENAGLSLKYDHVPRAVFTDPEVATVGITEEEYRRRHGRCLCSTVELEHVERAALMKDARGLVRMVVEPDTKRVVGVQMAGPMAADVITAATYAIRSGMSIHDIRDTVHVFPTMCEALKKAAQSFEQDPGEMPCCAE